VRAIVLLADLDAFLDPGDDDTLARLWTRNPASSASPSRRIVLTWPPARCERSKTVTSCARNSR